MGGSQGCFSSALREPSVELVRDDKDYDKPGLPSGPEGTQSLLLFGTLATDPELPACLAYPEKPLPLQEHDPGRAQQD